MQYFDIYKVFDACSDVLNHILEVSMRANILIWLSDNYFRYFCNYNLFHYNFPQQCCVHHHIHLFVHFFVLLYFHPDFHDLGKIFPFVTEKYLQFAGLFPVIYLLWYPGVDSKLYKCHIFNLQQPERKVLVFKIWQTSC